MGFFTRTGHITNTRKMLLKFGNVPAEQLASMNDRELGTYVAKYFKVLFDSNNNGEADTDTIILIPLSEFKELKEKEKLHLINR